MNKSFTFEMSKILTPHPRLGDYFRLINYGEMG
jgi:hypothetical protein